MVNNWTSQIVTSYDWDNFSKTSTLKCLIDKKKIAEVELSNKPSENWNFWILLKLRKSYIFFFNLPDLKFLNIIKII